MKAPIECVEPDWVRIDEPGWTGVRAVCRCDHSERPPIGGQCKCGALHIGIIRGEDPCQSA